MIPRRLSMVIFTSDNDEDVRVGFNVPGINPWGNSILIDGTEDVGMLLKLLAQSLDSFEL